MLLFFFYIFGLFNFLTFYNSPCRIKSTEFTKPLLFIFSHKHVIFSNNFTIQYCNLKILSTINYSTVFDSAVIHNLFSLNSYSIHTYMYFY